MKKFIWMLIFAGRLSVSAQDWSQLGDDIYGEAAGVFSGYSIGLSSNGTRVAIASYSISDGSDAGQIRIYEYVAGRWSQLGGDINGEAAGDWLGFSVSLSSDGSRVAGGAPDNDDGAGNAGQVRVFCDDYLKDSDHDGLSDGDEINNYGTDPDDSDTDGDSEPDGVEILMGFSPTNLISKLNFQGYLSGTTYKLEFNTTTGRLFIIESCDSLLDGEWVERLGLDGYGGPFVVTDPSLTTNRFYRINVR